MDVVRREVSRSKQHVSDVVVGLENSSCGGITIWDWRGGVHSGVNSLCPGGKDNHNPSCILLDGASRNENETTKLTLICFWICLCDLL